MIKEIKKMRILKEFDDYINNLKPKQVYTNTIAYYYNSTFIYIYSINKLERNITVSVYGMVLSGTLYLSTTEIKKYFKNKYKGYTINISK